LGNLAWAGGKTAYFARNIRMNIITIAKTLTQQMRSSRPKVIAFARLMGDKAAPNAHLAGGFKLSLIVFIAFSAGLDAHGVPADEFSFYE
jgi:hypothetical protein